MKKNIFTNKKYKQKGYVPAYRRQNWFTSKTKFYKKANLVWGFTLIELLVAIAIIGILSSIVLTSISSGKNKAKDVIVKQLLDEAQKQATLTFYTRTTNPETYFNICQNGSLGPNQPDGIGKFAQAAARAIGKSTYYYANFYSNNPGENVFCSYDHDAPYDSWVMEVPLKGSTVASPKLWCVDSTGVKKETTVSFSQPTPDLKYCP